MRLELALTAPPRIELRAKDHQYFVDGEPKRGWSQIARAAGLVEDLSRVPIEHLAIARARGAHVDDACARLMEGEGFAGVLEIVAADARPYVEAYWDLWQKLRAGITGLRVQTPLYCRGLDFCCTPDWHDDCSVNDLKATEKVSRTWGLQTAAQQLAHPGAMVRRIIHLEPKLKTRQYTVYTDHEGDRRIFSKLDYQVVEAACQLTALCAQCGATIADAACGPTHAALFAETQEPIQRWRSGE